MLRDGHGEARDAIADRLLKQFFVSRIEKEILNADFLSCLKPFRSAMQQLANMGRPRLCIVEGHQQPTVTDELLQNGERNLSF